MSDRLAHIPRAKGLPLVGSTLAFIRDAERWALAERERHGPTFAADVLGGERVIFGTPDAARTILMDRDDVYSSRIGWKWPIGRLFRRGLMLRDFDDHRWHRKAMQWAFRSAAMSTYVDMMNPIIERHVDRWAAQSSMSFYDAVKALTLEIAAVVFMGEAPGAEAERVNRSLMHAVKASVAPVRRELPLTQFRRGMDGRRYMQRYFAERIAQRRSDPGGDLFSQLCNPADPDARMSDDDIVDHMIFLLMAAHDTTTATLATMAWEFSRDLVWQERMRDEVTDVGLDALSWETRNDYPTAEHVFQEAMRLHPPVPFIPRGTVAASEIDGTHVPAKTLVTVATLLIHRHPDYWADPDRFDPDRFARAEHKQHSHMFVPFSGGAHTCVGMGFAGLMTTAITTQALQRLRFSTSPGQTEKIVTVPIPKPKYGLPLQVAAV